MYIFSRAEARCLNTIPHALDSVELPAVFLLPQASHCFTFFNVFFFFFIDQSDSHVRLWVIEDAAENLD